MYPIFRRHKCTLHAQALETHDLSSVANVLNATITLNPENLSDPFGNATSETGYLHANQYFDHYIKARVSKLRVVVTPLLDLDTDQTVDHEHPPFTVYIWAHDPAKEPIGTNGMFLAVNTDLELRQMMDQLRRKRFGGMTSRRYFGGEAMAMRQPGIAFCMNNKMMERYRPIRNASAQENWSSYDMAGNNNDQANWLGTYYPPDNNFHISIMVIPDVITTQHQMKYKVDIWARTTFWEPRSYIHTVKAIDDDAVEDDDGVPVDYTVAAGNDEDDQTHADL